MPMPHTGARGSPLTEMRVTTKPASANAAATVVPGAT
jgi:hypothetical protein